MGTGIAGPKGKDNLAIVVDVTVATDTPGISDNDVATKTYLGKGPVIPLQVEVMTGGGTDADKIHVYRQGVPSVVIGIPVRYIHDHVGLAHLDDYHNCIQLIFALVQNINMETLQDLDYNL